MASLQHIHIDPSSIDIASTRSIEMGNSFEEAPLNGAMQPSATLALHERHSFESEKQEYLSTTSPTSPTDEFDPCAIAKPYSPFYLYKHDSSHPSTEQSHLKVPGSAIHVSVQDLEVGDLTPTVTQDKRKRSDNGILRLWPSGKQCMTKPKETARDRFRKLPRWQQLSTKIIIAGLIIGAVVGIAVGISIKVHGGVYQSTNEQAAIST